jgi:hypothetical protein
MAKYTETVMVKDGGRERAVKVMITAPTLDGVDVQDLAQKAWRAPTKKIVDRPITVKVEAFRR